MTAEFAATRRDYRLIAGFAALSLITLAGIVAVRLLLPSPFAPRVNVRWVAGLTESGRADLERRFKLVAGEQREETTWTYDLGDPSPANVQALLGHPSVEDTFHIDRPRGVVDERAPRGSTLLVTRGPGAWRDSRTLDWLAVFCAASLLVSAAWLASTGRP